MILLTGQKNYCILLTTNVFLNINLYLCIQKSKEYKYFMQVSNNKKNKRLLASDIKNLVADYITSHCGKVNIASEVMYGSSRRVVDMLFIYKNNLYGIEIKSEADNTLRLPGQLAEYEKLFDYILIFSSKNHINKINDIINDGVGLFAIKDNSIVKIKNPSKNYNVDKMEMLNTIPSTVIKSKLNLLGNINSDDIRKIAKRISKKRIHDMLLAYLNELISNRQEFQAI